MSYEVKTYSLFDDIPKDIKEYFDLEDDPYDDGGILAIYIDNKLKAGYMDFGAPEDNTFSRNWSWVQEELEAAYEQGRADAFGGLKDENV